VPSASWRPPPYSSKGLPHYPPWRNDRQISEFRSPPSGRNVSRSACEDRHTARPAKESNTGFRLAVVVKNQRIALESVADILWRRVQLKHVLSSQRRSPRHGIQDAQLSPTFTSCRDKGDSRTYGFLVQPASSSSMPGPGRCDLRSPCVTTKPPASNSCLPSVPSAQ
jgi:hypothetical protein